MFDNLGEDNCATLAVQPINSLVKYIRGEAKTMQGSGLRGIIKFWLNLMSLGFFHFILIPFRVLSHIYVMVV